MFRISVFLIVWLVLAPVVVWAHSEETHDSRVTVTPNSESSESSFPLQVGGNFELIDHHGNPVSNNDYQGKHMLVFFGYASCKNMCSISLTRIGKTLELLGDSADKLAPLIITVDPDRDTPEVMKSVLAKYHPNLIGLTGEPNQLSDAYASYKQTPTSAGNDWDDDPIISHSSYIYLMNEAGEFTTLFPPVLNPQSMADIIRKYVDDAA